MKITKIETFTDSKFIKGVTLVKVTTNTNNFGWGQISPYNSDISTEVLYRQVAPFVIGADISNLNDLGNLIDLVYDKQHKFPGTYMCRALGGLDTAIWDLHGRLINKPVCDLIGNCKTKKIRVYGSSMKRQITPADEVDRFKTHLYTMYNESSKSVSIKSLSRDAYCICSFNELIFIFKSVFLS